MTESVPKYSTLCWSCSKALYSLSLARQVVKAATEMLARPLSDCLSLGLA